MLQDMAWLKFYDPHVPASIDYPEQTIPQAMAETAKRCPDQPAIIFKGTRIPYRALDQSVDRFGAALQGMGIQKGDRVAIHLPNVPQFAIAYLGTLRIGAVAVPCNPVYTARELKHQLRDSGAKAIVTLSSHYPRVREIRGETNLEAVIVAKLKTYLPPVLRLLFTLLKERSSGHGADIRGAPDTYWFDELLKTAPATPVPEEIAWDDTAVLMYTGGTTGLSKGAQLTHKNIFVNAYQVTVWANTKEGEDCTLAALPLFHSYGMTCCLNSGAIKAGAAILVPDPRDIEDIVNSIEKYRPSFFPGVPAMYVAVINHPQAGQRDLTSLKFCNSGAAPLPQEVQERFQELTKARLVEGYGLSEASPVTHSNPAYGDSRIGTIGVPWPDTEAKIVDADTGEQTLGMGEVGELCVRGPQVMKGYWNMPSETANVLRPDPGGGGPWLYTGDLAVMDGDGYFKIVDRKKDMILGAGGYNVYPREIEDVLYEHPAVLEAGAVGVPVLGKGERVKVFVSLKPGKMATEEEIIEFCRQNLAPYKVPKYVEFWDELPKTLTGKILRRALIEEGQEGEGSE
jgi:long-chain acyl-CoA synthetase